MKTYKIVLSTKQEILIDQDDFEKVIANASKGVFIILKQGMVNPSFIVAILPNRVKEGEQKQVEGYIDPIKKVFVVTKETTLDSPVLDEFGTKELAEKMSLTDNRSDWERKNKFLGK